MGARQLEQPLPTPLTFLPHPPTEPRSEVTRSMMMMLFLSRPHTGSGFGSVFFAAAAAAAAALFRIHMSWGCSSSRTPTPTVGISPLRWWRHSSISVTFAWHKTWAKSIEWGSFWLGQTRRSCWNGCVIMTCSPRSAFTLLPTSCSHLCWRMWRFRTAAKWRTPCSQV